MASGQDNPATRVPNLYKSVIAEVIKNCHDAFLNDGVDDQVLADLKSIWEFRLEASKAVESIPAPPPVAKEQQYVASALQPHLQTPHLQTPSAAPSVISGGGQALVFGQMGARQQHVRPTASMSVPAVAGVLPPSFVARSGISSRPNQTDGAQEEPVCLAESSSTTTSGVLKSSGHAIVPDVACAATATVSPLAGRRRKRERRLAQLDGAHGSSDEDDEDDEDPEDDDDEDDDDEEAEDGMFNEGDGDDNENQEVESLGSDDDGSSEGSDVFETENVVVCQFDKVTRSRNRWKFVLKDGIMNLNGKDYVFQKLNGEAEW